MLDNDIVINVENLTKEFNLYAQPVDRVKEAINPWKKTYHKVYKALDTINFQVKKGETVGIIGSNGAGKSTLLKLITGVIKQTSGNIEVNGRVSALLELGTGFNPEYTGIENIDLNGKMMGLSKAEIEARKEDIIRFADIGEYIYQPVKNYSSGMFARLAFAVAISVEPEILIVDEALSVGDIFFQNKCFQKFDELKNKGTSILFVSHDLSTVRKMCSNVLWIEHGQQIRYGISRDVCDAYFDSQILKINAKEGIKEALDQKLKEKSTSESHSFPKIEIAENSVLSDRVEVVSTYLKDKNDKYVHVMQPGENYILGIVVSSYENLENAIIGASVNNSKGVTIVAFNTYISLGRGLKMDKGETYVAEFCFTAPKIRSGSYEISPAVAIGTQESHNILTWLHGVLGIDIESCGYEIAEIQIESELKMTTL